MDWATLHDAGSSPLTRGKPASAHQRWRRGRLIPAHAGKTTVIGLAPYRLTAHPRSRGENAALKLTRLWSIGSSPLTRGKLPKRDLSGGSGRLIPAHAGKTCSPAPPGPRPSAHPRSRGENVHIVRMVTRQGGSSPLTRGKLKLTAVHPASNRLIPAHAGKTADHFGVTLVNKAHPRSRGENSRSSSASGATCGSSPLTRGKPDMHKVRIFEQRLIPAHAGKTKAPPPESITTAAHPRSRGENLHLVGGRLKDRGSSPLTRGKPHPQKRILFLFRLIPAHAGKTSQRRSPAS